MSSVQETLTGIQRNRKAWPIQKKKSTETVPKKDLMADTLDKDFKRTVLKMLKEVTKDVGKIKNKQTKTVCELSTSIRDKKNLHE